MRPEPKLRRTGFPVMIENTRDKPNKPDKRDEPRLSEDDIAQARLGGPRGSPELPPAKMTPQRRKKTPDDVDPGHTA